MKGPEFDLYNTTSIEYLFHCAACLERDLLISPENARNTIIDFIQWYRQNKEDCYVPTHGMERMYSMNETAVYIRQIEFINQGQHRVELIKSATVTTSP